MDERRRDYATMLEEGFNIGKSEDEAIHVHYEKTVYVNPKKMDFMELLNRIEYHFVMNKYLCKSEYEAMLKSILY